jgi:dihydrofolate reductase
MQLTVHTFLSLDGVMQGPGGPEEDRSDGFDQGGWLVPLVDEGFNRFTATWFERSSAFLLGRGTYEAMASVWPFVDPESDPAAAALNGLEKHVVSTTLTDPSWANTTVIATDVLDRVRSLKEQPGGELQVHGSHGLVRTLIAAGLVDEFRLITFPVVLGRGKRLFDDATPPSGFTVVAAETSAGGLTHHVLRPAPLAHGVVVARDGVEVLESV